MTDTPPQTYAPEIPWWKPVLFAAFAGGMGWGIRGQYGHENGAMIAGCLVTLTLCFLLARNMPIRQQVQAIALGIIAMGWGGSMSYGETVGLTQDTNLHNLVEGGVNWAAWRWGGLGFSSKMLTFAFAHGVLVSGMFRCFYALDESYLFVYRTDTRTHTHAPLH